LAKTCVFCGNKPRGKTKEHVIPLWLIEFTGESGRKVALGWNKEFFGKELVAREFAFDQLVFPACGECNTRYSNIEAAAKRVVMAILNGREIEAFQASEFMDWLDKIRIGLWLGFMQLDNNYWSIDPNFHIDGRVGQHDRMVIVGRTDAKHNRLNFNGIDCLSFALTPSVFAMTINSYCFINISYQFLFARRIGFPYPSESQLTPDGRLYSVINPGIGRIVRPLIRKPIRPHRTILYQPMFKGGLVEPAVEYYDMPYVRRASLDFERGVGDIFIDTDGALSQKKAGDFFTVCPKVAHSEYRYQLDSAIEVYEWQNWIASKLLDATQLEKTHRRRLKEQSNFAKRMNDALIEHCLRVKRHYGL